MSKIKIVCAECGSEDVMKDAYAAWSVEDQQWELASIHDKGDVCENCGGQTTLQEVIL